MSSKTPILFGLLTLPVSTATAHTGHVVRLPESVKALAVLAWTVTILLLLVRAPRLRMQRKAGENE